MKNILILFLLLLTVQPVSFSQKPTKWVLIGYRVQEKVQGCNPRWAKYGYAWVCDGKAKEQFEQAVKENYAGTPVMFYYHPDYKGNVIAVVEKTIRCSSKSSTHPSYDFFSAKDQANLSEQLERNKKNSVDIKDYRIVKTIDYRAETDKFKLTGQCFVEGEIN